VAVVAGELLAGAGLAAHRLVRPVIAVGVAYPVMHRETTHRKELTAQMWLY
jgi:hypothetical protein